MPDMDGTGPLGKGPLTGGKKGRCRGSGKNHNTTGNSESYNGGRGYWRGKRNKGERKRYREQNMGKRQEK